MEKGLDIKYHIVVGISIRKLFLHSYRISWCEGGVV